MIHLHILIGIDGTDSLESIGTGEVLLNLCAQLSEKRLGRCGFITRHQLYVHVDIAYTTHNSAMCCDAEINDLDAVVRFCRSYMDKACADGSDPGLCIVDLEKLRYKKRLIRFGLASKKMVLKKQDALDVTALHKWAVFVSEHGGTGDGVIGALAGCGLRLSGFDGRVKGRLDPPKTNQLTTVDQLCRDLSLPYAIDKDKRQVNPADTVLFSCQTKAVLWNHLPALCLLKDKSGKAVWRVCGINELKGLVD